jgi:Ricin-type beta-trefoil lectin domain
MSTRSKFLSIVAACISFAAISTAMASAAKADQIYVFHNSGMALNTNNSFSKIDGTPRMSLWSRNDNDPDQQFTELYSSQNRGVRFMHKSTGLCLNAHTLKDGGSVNLWNCDANDPDQSFTVQDLGGGKSFLKRAGTNFCVDSPTRNANGLIHLIQCNPSNFNQQWMISKRNVVNPPSNDVLQRAKVWVDQRVSYNQGSYYQGYRQDCSGFVSMAWRLPTSAVTGTLPQYSNTLSSLDQLQPGDAINNRKSGNYGHVVLFVAWVDKAQGKFTAYEENGGLGSAQTTLTIKPFGNGTYVIKEYSSGATPPWFLERKR